MRKTKRLLEEHIYKIRALWENKQYFRAIASFVILVAILGLILAAIFYVTNQTYNFLHRHYAEILVTAFIFLAFVGWLDNHREKKQKLREWERENSAREVYKARLDFETTKEATYIEQGKIIFDVARELGILGIVPPMRMSNIYSPSRMIPKANGTFSLALFLLQKDREQVDVELLRQTLQTKIDQRLIAGEYPAIEEKHLYKGRAYSGFIVDSARESQGYVEVYTVLTNDAYCRYRQERDLMAFLPDMPVDRRDIDY